MAKSYDEQLQNNLNVFKQIIDNAKIIGPISGKPVVIDFNSVQGKVMYALINALTNVGYNNDRNFEFLTRQFFPQTANYEALKEFHGNTYSVLPYTETPATGYVIFTGTEGGTIPQGTQISSTENTYTTNETTIISKANIKVNSLTSSAGQATVVLSQDYKTASGMKIARIYGANESKFNKENFTITTISTNSFTYEVDPDTPTTATGEIYVDIISAAVLVTSTDVGESQNAIAGTSMTLNVPRVDIDEDCYVYYDGITGGKNAETDEEYRSRVLSRIRGIPQGWNRSNIMLQIRDFQYAKYNEALIFIPRAEKVTGEVVSGFTTIYMLKKDLTTLSNTECEDIKNYLINTIYKINPTTEQVNVINPVLKTVVINISIINGVNTIDMKNSVQETIKEMQNDQTVCYFRKNITKKTIESWLDQVIDSNGNGLEGNYILNMPIDDVVNLEYNEFPILQLEINQQ